MEYLNKVWNDNHLKGLTRIEPRELEQFQLDFEMLNNALKVLHKIMGGKG